MTRFEASMYGILYTETKEFHTYLGIAYMPDGLAELRVCIDTNEDSATLRMEELGGEIVQVFLLTDVTEALHNRIVKMEVEAAAEELLIDPVLINWNKGQLV